MKLKLICLVMPLLICIGCSESWLHRINTQYIATKDFFPEKFVNHFPAKLKNDFVGRFNSVMDTNSYHKLSLFLAQELDSVNFNTCLDSLKRKSRTEYSVNDSSLFIIDEKRNDSNVFKPYSKIVGSHFEFDNNMNEKIPIPNFYMTKYHNLDQVMKLQDDFRLFILDVKKGKFWDDKYLSDGKYMPQDWQHGYSKGITISEEKLVVIYWFIIW